ncbi:MAG: GHMP kinase [Chloroflexales bacterium]|nr:GHMP kinase [Chloroflexales bacterium]
MVQTNIPPDFADMVAPMRAAHEQIIAALQSHQISFDDYPKQLPPANPHGAAAARAYPMQGILKYHGLSDWDWRIAFLPSISVCNDAAYTLTFVAFDPDLPADQVTIGGTRAQGRDLERVQQTLNVVRSIAGVTSRAHVVSRNVTRASITGKGLGSSASGSAALATAAVAALFGAEIIHNRRFLSCIARLLAGSGCRSAAGGLSLWLSYPGIAPEDSLAVRLDTYRQLDEMSLITAPIDSRVGLKTELAHHDAPNSSFFKVWMASRGTEIIECIAAIQAGDWRTVGQLAELDSIRLHGVTMSGSREQKIFGWEPENMTLFRMCNDLRAEGIPVYASTDTGPTVVFLTHRDYVAAVIERIHGLQMGFEAIAGQVAGPAELVATEQACTELEVV